MKHILITAAALAAATGQAQAGALDRSGQSVAAIFETGTYAELSFGAVSADVGGTAAAFLGGFGSGDMIEDHNQVGAAFKMDLSDSLAIGLIYDQPFGADVAYPTGTGYYAAGTRAHLSTEALTLVAKYRLPSNLSLFGGLRYQTFAANAAIPFVAGYSVTGARDASVGYLVGVAYEKPEIALRVALTYNSAIEHRLDTVEFDALTSVTTIEAPQSVNLEFQSGIARDTLLFGSIRWVDWSEFVIDPLNYPPGDALVSYDGDYTTYMLGLGRRFSDRWSGAVTVGYEAPLGGFSSNLGPADGQRSVGLAATYTLDRIKITGGVRYIEVGDTDVTLDDVNASASFTGNSGVAVGMKVAYSF